jgi:hypothetical protein
MEGVCDGSLATPLRRLQILSYLGHLPLHQHPLSLYCFPKICRSTSARQYSGVNWALGNKVAVVRGALFIRLSEIRSLHEVVSSRRLAS